jgi:hypothetical protein
MGLDCRGAGHGEYERLETHVVIGQRVEC